MNEIQMRNTIGSILAEPLNRMNDDNLAIALAVYFEGLSDCPDDDTDDEVGWSRWAMQKVNDLEDRIVAAVRRETIEECAKIIEEHEREHWEHVGHPMVPGFVPYWANELRALADAPREVGDVQSPKTA